VLLAGTVGGVGYIAFRFLIVPLREPVDNLALALRIEGFYPFLKDGLASTVQFLERSDDIERLGSLDLRRRAVERALEQVEGLDFNRAVKTGGAPLAGLFSMGAIGLALLLALRCPVPTWTALERLANPFGSLEWPRHTRLDIQAPSRVARGEAVEIRASVRGEIPSEGKVEFVEHEGWPGDPQFFPIVRGKESNTGTLIARRERADTTFRFQVRANDAVSDWHEVQVLPPPVLVSLDGRASPQVHLTFPDYTDLPPQDLPGGTGNIEAVAGTLVSLRAATDRPVALAWIEYRPEQLLIGHAAFLGPLGTLDPGGCLVSMACARAIGEPIPVRLDSTGRLLSVTFLPRISGTYALRFEDDSGLGNTRLLDVRIFRDPEPTVNLARPSPAYDTLDVLPGADVTVQAVAEDPQFALRSVFVEYRCRKNDPPRRLFLYEHASWEQVVPQILAALTGQPGPPQAMRLRPQRLRISRCLSLRDLKHPDGSSLREGDILTLQAGADDFDTVAVDKKPGRSHEVELRLVSRTRLEDILSKAQTQVQQELVRLRKMQQEAIRQVIGPEQQWRNTGRLRERDVDQLLQTEQLQQQIRTRIGLAGHGLQAKVARILNTFRANQLVPSEAQSRMEIVAAELDRLAQRELELIEPRLAQARKEQAIHRSIPKPQTNEKDLLGAARQTQEEIARTLTELLQLLEAWGDTNEIKAEARSIFQEQLQLREETDNFPQSFLGHALKELDSAQKAALSKDAVLQRELAERASDLLRKMDRISREHSTDGAMAEALHAAATQGLNEDVPGLMKSAAEKIQANQLETAGRAQVQALQALEGVVKALGERHEQEFERLRKKLHESEDKVADLARRQDLLRKKIKAVEAGSDSPERQRELNRLAREQDVLRQETQELLRELTRLQTERGRQALRDAGDAMEETARQLKRDEPTEETQEEALARLDEARQALKQEQGDLEEKLAREKLAKLADQIKGLRERQEELVAEGTRLHREVSNQRELDDYRRQRSLTDLAKNQKGLGEETAALAKDKLAGAQVFARILNNSSEVMSRASMRILENLELVPENRARTAPDPEWLGLQRQALRHLVQLVEAVTPEKNLAQRVSGPREGETRRGARPRGAPDGISFLAQLKALRGLQKDVNDRTEAFARRRSGLATLNPDEERELETLRKDQQEIEELFERLTQRANSKEVSHD
jgi:hypothetical protein